jgi:hypothetical protein
MLSAAIFAVVIVLGPIVLVIGTLALLSAVVATMADAVPNGLVRPNPS